MATAGSARQTIRDLGYTPGSLPSGPSNSILDVPGVHISQVTVPTTSDLPDGSTATKGVTVISPRPPKEYYKPCNAGSFVFNGNGELTGSQQIADWAFTNTPIAFTNSFSLGSVFDGVWDYVMRQQDTLGWDEITRSRHYGTPVVGETADWIVNADVRHSRVSQNDIKWAFDGLRSREDGAVVQEGQYGGGAGMTCHNFAGGSGTSSRLVGGGEGSHGEYTLGVLVQSNYGRLSELHIGGIPVGKMLLKEKANEAGAPLLQREGGVGVSGGSKQSELDGRAKDGSILILIVTDAPLTAVQLQRLARHATTGLAQVGGHAIGKTFSGDIFLALSTAEHPPEQLDVPLGGPTKPVQTYTAGVVKNECVESFFIACAEATEEAILNSIVGGRHGTIGMTGEKIDGLPVDKVKELIQRHLVIV